jgi:hypothetical protein
MVMTNCLDYFNEKKSLLDQLVDLSEALVGDPHDFDLFVATLDQREVIIQKLAQLESQYKPVFDPFLSLDQAGELNRLVDLLASLDAYANAILSDEKNKITDAIRNNILEQKLFKYNGDPLSENGNLIDCKK